MKISVVLIISLLLVSIASSAPRIPKAMNTKDGAPRIVGSKSTFSRQSVLAEERFTLPVHVEVTTTPSAPDGYKCLASHGEDPRAWSVETIEEYCTRPMLKCQCDLAKKNMAGLQRTASKYRGSENEKVNLGGRLGISIREGAESVTDWMQMCQLDWIEETVCDDETNECAMELFGRFVFGYGVGAVKNAEHKSWWAICEKKLEQEGEVPIVAAEE